MQEARILVLPGVGAAADTMHNLQERDLAGPIRDYVDSGRPFLGICMGLQALMTVSEEGGLQKCLNIVPGRVIRLPEGLKVPHMGWNQVELGRRHPALPQGLGGQYFYFVHSYYAEPADSSIVAGWTDYGVRFPFHSGQGQPDCHSISPRKERRDWTIDIRRLHRVGL